MPNNISSIRITTLEHTIQRKAFKRELKWCHGPRNFVSSLWQLGSFEPLLLRRGVDCIQSALNSSYALGYFDSFISFLLLGKTSLYFHWSRVPHTEPRARASSDRYAAEAAREQAIIDLMRFFLIVLLCRFHFKCTNIAFNQSCNYFRQSTRSRCSNSRPS